MYYVVNESTALSMARIMLGGLAACGAACLFVLAIIKMTSKE